MNTRTEKNLAKQKEIQRETTKKKMGLLAKIITIILLFIFSIIAYGNFIGSKIININEQKLIYNNIPDSFHGLKIVHFSDILYNSINSKELNKTEKLINNLDADIIFFTGDIIKKNYELNKKDIDLLESFFSNLHANIEKYAVIGNNDNNTFDTIMENSNFKALKNEKTLLFYKDTTPIQIIGFDTNNLNFKNITYEDYFTIVLTHNPDDNKKIIDSIDTNLILAGDNLNGEVNIPLIRNIFTNHTYNSKYYQINNTDLYISNGLGNNHNIRLFNRPSINFYRLTKY